MFEGDYTKEIEPVWYAYKQLPENERKKICEILEAKNNQLFQSWMQISDLGQGFQSKEIAKRSTSDVGKRLDEEILKPKNIKIFNKVLYSFFYKLEPLFLNRICKLIDKQQHENFSVSCENAFTEIHKEFNKFPLLHLFKVFFQYFEKKDSLATNYKFSLDKKIKSINQSLDLVIQEMEKLKFAAKIDLENITISLQKIIKRGDELRCQAKKIATAHAFKEPDWTNPKEMNEYFEKLKQHVEAQEKKKKKNNNKLLELAKWLKNITVQHRSPRKQVSLEKLKQNVYQELYDAGISSSIHDIPGPLESASWLNWALNLNSKELTEVIENLEKNFPYLTEFIESCELDWIKENRHIQDNITPKELEKTKIIENTQNHSTAPAITEQKKTQDCIQEKQHLSTDTNKSSEDESQILQIASEVSVNAKKPCSLTEPKPLSDLAQDVLNSLKGQQVNAIQNLIWQLILDDQLSFAFHLSLYLEENYPQNQYNIPSWLLRSVILGSQAYYDSKEPSYSNDFKERSYLLQNDFSKFDEHIFYEGKKEWNKGIRLLLASAALIPSLLVPHSGASNILQNIHIGGDFKQLYDFITKTIAPYGELGVSLNPLVIKSAKTVGAWQDELNIIKQGALTLWEQARSISLSYKPAGRVWKKWLDKDEIIHSLLQPVIKDDIRHLKKVEALISTLSSDSAIERAVRKTVKEIPNLRGRYTSQALTQLVRRIQDILNTSENWLKHQKIRPGKSRTFVEEKARGLKQKIEENYPKIQDELKSNLDHAPVIIRSGITLFQKTLINLYNLFDPNVSLSSRFLNVQHLLCVDLLRISNITLSDKWQYEKDIDIAEVIATYLASDTKDWKTTFLEHCKKGDHRAASRIIDLINIHPVADVDTEALQIQKEKSCDSWKATIEKQIASTQKKVSDALSLGLLTENEYLTWSAEIDIEEKLETTHCHFELRSILESVIEKIKKRRSSEVDSVKARLKEIEMSKEVEQHIENVLTKADVHTANDYIDRIQRGDTLPQLSNKSFAFLDFFDKRETLGHFFVIENSLSNKDKKNKVREIIKNIHQRKNLFGMSLQQISGAQASQASEMVNTWFAIKSQRKIDEQQIRLIMNHLGFNTLSTEIVQHGVQTWLKVKTEPIQESARCPVAAYGSQAKGIYHILCVWERPNEEDLLFDMDTSSQYSGSIVFHFGRMTEPRRRDLAKLCREHRRQFIVLDDVLLLYLCFQRGSRLPVLFQCSLPFSFLEPYTTTAGLVSPEMFYGRKREINQIVDPFGSCFLYGGRQLGKTALLRYVEQNFHKPEKEQIVFWLDLKSEGIGTHRSIDYIWTILIQKLKKAKVIASTVPSQTSTDRLFEHIENWLNSDGQRRILLLLDESDVFLESDGKDTEGKEPFFRCSQIKGLMDKTKRRFKVVFAGLHNVQRTTRVANNPLVHYGEAICIGPLLKNGEARIARELVEWPLACLGYFFETPDLVIRILAQTNYYPSLIQLYCLHLLRHLNERHDGLFNHREVPPYLIKARHIEDAYHSLDLRKAIRDRFMWTLDLDKRYRVIAFILALYKDKYNTQGFDIQWIREEAMVFWPKGFSSITSNDRFQELLEEMVGLGILRRIPSTNRYALRSPNVVMLLGNKQEIEADLEECETNLELPSEYEPQTFRRAIQQTPSKRSPLTAHQENKIKDKRNGVFVICGCTASGLEDLPLALESLFGKDFYIRAKNLNQYHEHLKNVASRKVHGTSCLLICSDVNWDKESIELALNKISRLKSQSAFISIVFVANPHKIWQSTQALTELQKQKLQTLTCSPWHIAALRQWLDDCQLGSRKSKERQEIYSATGNWPYLIHNFQQYAKNETSKWTKEGLQQFRKTFLDEQKKLDIFGLNLAEPYKILRVMAEYGEPLSIGELKELITDPKITEKTIKKCFDWATLLNILVLADGGWIQDKVVSDILLATKE